MIIYKIKKVILKQVGILLFICVRKYNEIVFNEKNKEVQRRNKKLEKK